MAKGQTYNHERIARPDPTTGVEILQLTSFPVPNIALSYMSFCFTPDSHTVVFSSQREPRRDSPFDLFRVDADGTRLTQLTDADGISHAGVSRDGARVLYLRGRQLWATDLESCRDEMLFDEKRIERPISGASISHDGRFYFVGVALAPSGRAIARFRTDGSGVDLLPNAKGYYIHACDPGGSGLLCGLLSDSGHDFWLLDYDASNERFFTRNVFAHSNWLGATGRFQGCGEFPIGAILVASCGQRNPEPLVRGPYFWHSYATPDGEWIVADTNWPDEGLQLVNARTRRFRTHCYPQASQGHAQWTHPHPILSPDGKLVLFNSDRTGMAQLYLAKIPDEMREDLSRAA
jgi:hypothetical protein